MVLVYVASALPAVKLIANNLKGDFLVGGKARRGATDGILVEPAGRRTHVEFKSSSAIGFKMTMQKGLDDTFGYLGQAEVYVRELLRLGLVNNDKTLFVYINRDTMHLGEVEHTYTGEYAKRADENFRLIDECLATRKLPERPYALENGNQLPLNCAYCGFKWSCWTEPNQVVKFDTNGKATYRLQPEKTLEMQFDKRGKPKFFVV
jgi:hypothetical protein